MDTEIFYERITALCLTQLDDNNKLVRRYFPQVERVEVTYDDDTETSTEKADWVVLNDKNNKTVYFDNELDALKHAISYRNKRTNY